jgi:transposase-like protein
MANSIVRFKLAKYRDIEEMLAGRGFGDGNDAIRRRVINFGLFYAVRGPNLRRAANQKQLARERLLIDQAHCDKLEGFAV